MKYSLHPDALGDLRDAASFYREQAGTNLSQSFLGEFERSIDVLLLHPSLGSPWRRPKRRRYRMKHFPYSLIYSTSEDEIRILAVAHHSRRPDYWAERN
jgi:toxin ParE1/3/4